MSPVSRTGYAQLVTEVLCGHCQTQFLNPFRAGRPRKYCSEGCSHAAHLATNRAYKTRQRRKEKDDNEDN